MILGSYTCLEVKINFQRDLSSYINELFVPSTLVVSFSFVSFFLDYKNVNARAPLGAINVLTVTFLISGIYEEIKNVKIVFSKCLHNTRVNLVSFKEIILERENRYVISNSKIFPCDVLS